MVPRVRSPRVTAVTALVVVRFALIAGFRAHDDPRGRCRGTGVATDAIARAAAMIVDGNPRRGPRGSCGLVVFVVPMVSVIFVVPVVFVVPMASVLPAVPDRET